MDIAIIGTSPIILIQALKLANKHNVKIFDYSKNIGGAWSIKKFGKYLKIPRQTNAVVPTSLKEEKKIIKLNKNLMKKLHIKIEKFDNFNFKQKYKPKNIFFYDFSLFYEKIKKKIPIQNKKINKIIIKEKNFYLGNQRFDKVLIPYFNSINFVKDKQKKILIKYELFKSKHVVFIMKKKISKKLIYEEYTDNVFDRYLINGKKNYFVGRVSREYKKKSLKTIIKKTNIKFLSEKNIKKKTYFYYKNFKRNEKQIKTLINKNKNKNLVIINTKQLATSLTKFL